jgi:toxin ParE1/3/4
MRVIIDESAVEDLDVLGAWIAKDSPRAAQRIIEEILQTIERLAVFPEMGHVGRIEGVFERAVSGTNYVVVYNLRKTPKAIIVTAVLHEAEER